jgi:hypothetical protein
MGAQRLRVIAQAVQASGCCPIVVQELNGQKTLGDGFGCALVQQRSINLTIPGVFSQSHAIWPNSSTRFFAASAYNETGSRNIHQHWRGIVVAHQTFIRSSFR